MFKVYSELALYSMVLAQEFSAEYNQSVSGVHLLLASVQNPLGTAGAAWDSCGLSRNALREQLQEISSPDAAEDAGEPSTAFAAALKRAWTERLNMSHSQILTGHILIGLVEEESYEINAVFNRLGIQKQGLLSCIKAELVNPERTSVESLNPDPNLLSSEFLNRLNPDAFLAFTFAEKECRRRGTPFLGSEHLLLGIMMAQACDASAAELGELEAVRFELNRMLGQGAGWFPAEPILSRRVSSILNDALINANGESSKEITLGHLRAAILREPKGIAARVRDKLGLQLA